MAIWGRVPDVEEAVARIDAVTVGAVRDYAGEADGGSRVCARALRSGRAAPGLEALRAKARRLMVFMRRKVRIETERMTLRLPVQRDLRAGPGCATAVGFLQPWEPSWAEDHLCGRPLPTGSIGRARGQQGTALPLFLIRREEQMLVGAITLDNIRRGPAQAGTLGYWVGAPFARQGYMREAILARGASRLHARWT